MPWKPADDPGAADHHGGRTGAGVRVGGRAGKAAWAIGVAAAGCASEQPPPGALPDSRPPQVARFIPAPDSVVPGFSGSASVRFDEPVRLGPDLTRRIRTSPAYRYEFKTGFSGIDIKPQGGWREGAVYCFEIPSGISDLLNNRTETPIDFCFSTGPPVLPTRVEGRVEVRLTGAAVGGARILFLALPEDSTPYTAEADAQGNFSLRALPPGSYWAYGFEDRNRNLRLDRALEPHDSLHFEIEEATRPPALALALVEPDSTSPVLVAARAEDGLTVRLEFDDPLLLDQPQADIIVRDSGGARLAWRILHVGEPAGLPPGAREEAGEEGPPGAAEAPEAGEGAPPELEPAVTPRGAAGGAERAAQERRPARVVTLVLREALAPGRYAVEARGLRNLRGLIGGGEAEFVYPAERGW